MDQPTTIKKYHVTLTDDERSLLRELLSAGKASARTLTHARILLKADESGENPACRSRFGGRPGTAHTAA
jgi:hypothetical protein